MKTGSIIEANRALTALSSRAGHLDAIDLPRFGRAAAQRERAASQLAYSALDAERAVMVLSGVAGFAPQSIESIRHAAQLLRAAEPTSASITHVATTLRSAVENTRAAWTRTVAGDPDTAAVHLADIMHQEPATLARSDWSMLRQLLDVAPATPSGPHELDGMPGLAEIATRQASIPAHLTPDVTDATPYFATWRLGGVLDEARAAPALRLLQRPPETLAPDDWKTLLTHLDADPLGRVLPATRALDIGPSVRDVVIRRSAASAAPPGRALDMATTRDHRQFERFQAAWRVERSTVTERVDQLRGLVARDPSSLDRGDWATLRALISDTGVASQVRGPRRLTSASTFDHVANVNFERPMPEEMRDAERYFHAWRLASAPTEARVARAGDIVTRDPSQLTKADWEDLATVLESDPSLLPRSAPRLLEQVDTFIERAREYTRSPDASTPQAYAVNEFFAAWRAIYDPEHSAKFAAAIEDVVAGTPSMESRSIVAGEGHRLAELVAGRPAHEQAAIASVMLDTGNKTTPSGIGETLEKLHSLLTTSSDQDPARMAIRARTLELIELNLARINGRTPTGAVRGWGHHPDYAEVGRIRANVVLLDRLQRPVTEATPSATSVTW